MLKIILMILIGCLLLLALYIIANRIYLKNTDPDKLLKDLDKKFQRSTNNSILLIEDQSGHKNHLVTHNIKPSDKIIIASITKLYTHALIYAMADRGLIDLDKPISDYLPESSWTRLHQFKGQEHSQKIRVMDLINQTSGLPDYEMDIKGTQSVIKRFKKEDFTINDKDAIRLTRTLEAKFEPGDPKAHYSNVNAILLGLIAEQVSNQSLIELYQDYIFTPLGLENTEIITKNNHVFASMDKEPVDRTHYISSALACGGLVSTVEDMMTFIKAFYQGDLFSKAHIEDIQFYRIQFFPVKYGGGMMSVAMPAWMSPIVATPKIIGHSGLSGSFSYYCPEKELFVVGTLNQYEANPFKWIYQYINAIADK